MTYNPINFNNGKAGGTPVSASNLRHVENGIVAAHNDIAALTANVNSLSERYGTPLVAHTAAEMTDNTKIYVYVGSETGYTTGNWYYYDGDSWESGGAYNSTAINTDKTLTQEDMAADAKKVGDELSDLKSAIGDFEELNPEIEGTNVVEAINYVYENGGGTPAVKYTITNNLHNVINPNGATNIREGKPYTTTLALVEGGILDSVSVIMGGVDITETVWNLSTMQISIPSVTNSVVINASAHVVLDVSVRWTQYASAAVRFGTSEVIDARNHNVYITVPYTEGYANYASGVTSESNCYGYMSALYNDAEMTSLVGYYYGGTIHDTWSNAAVPKFKFNTELLIAPAGYYAVPVLFNSASAFTSNSNSQSYANTYAKTLQLVEVEQEEEPTNAELTDADLLRMYKANAVSLSTSTTQDTTSYEGVIETAKNEWMLEYGGSINKIPLIVHTDQHGYMTPTNSSAMWEAIDGMVSWYDISRVINLGDTTNSYEHYDNPALGDSVLASYLKATEAIPWSKRTEVFGNHDCMSIIDSALTAIHQPQSYMNPYFKNVMADRVSDWGYHVTYDPYFRVKYIVYSPFEFEANSNHYRISSDQYSWLMKELSKDDGYDIVMCGHVMVDGYYYPKLKDLVSARYNKTSGTFTDDAGVTYPYDFRSLTGNMLVCLCGHEHNDSYNYNQTVLSRCFDRYYASNRPIYFVIIDRENNQLKLWKVTNDPAYTVATLPFIDNNR